MKHLTLQLIIAIRHVQLNAGISELNVDIHVCPHMKPAYLSSDVEVMSTLQRLTNLLHFVADFRGFAPVKHD